MTSHDKKNRTVFTKFNTIHISNVLYNTSCAHVILKRSFSYLSSNPSHTSKVCSLRWGFNSFKPNSLFFFLHDSNKHLYFPLSEDDSLAKLKTTGASNDLCLVSFPVSVCISLFDYKIKHYFLITITYIKLFNFQKWYLCNLRIIDCHIHK